VSPSVHPCHAQSTRGSSTAQPAQGSSAAHSALVNEIISEFGSLPGVIIGANASGRALYTSEAGKRFRVPYGWPCAGGPDILAVVAPNARLVALECKTGDAVPTKTQLLVHEALRGIGALVRVVRSIEEARAVFAEVCQ
jgi:hypothetical protein